MSISTALQKFLNNFKNFAVQSRSTDIAVGMLLGAAIEPLARSFVDEVIMPPLGLLGKDKLDLKSKYILLKDGKRGGPYNTEEEAKNDGAVIIGYGRLISNVLNFIILSGSAYAFVSLLNKLKGTTIDIPTKEEILSKIGAHGLGGVDIPGYGHEDKYNAFEYNIPSNKRELLYFRQKSPVDQKEFRRRLQVNRSPFYDIYNQYYAHKGNSGVYAQEKMPAWEDFVYDSRYWKTTLMGNFKKSGPVPLVHFPVAYREEVEGKYLSMPYSARPQKPYNFVS